MGRLRRTPFYERHLSLGAQMGEFGGWEMPMYYPTGIVMEHLMTRKEAGLFDVSHMGRFVLTGRDALPFLQEVLSNNAGALDPRIIGAQYTFVQKENGGALDDAYLYCFTRDEYLLVVNAANAQMDWDYLAGKSKNLENLELIDRTEDMVMLSLQGPKSRDILLGVVDSGSLPEPLRNAVGTVNIAGAEVLVARTGYTGEPLCFELFAGKDHGVMLWDMLVKEGAAPAGLGARDTLRLEAGLPLHGHELGTDADGREIPIMASPGGRIGVSLSSLKGEFIGKEALSIQLESYKRILARDYSMIQYVPRMIRPIALSGRGVARSGAKVFKDNKEVGYVTSGTMVPMWKVKGEGLDSVMEDDKILRSIALGYIDSDIVDEDKVEVEIRGKRVEGVVVPYHLRSEAPPYARPILFDFERPADRRAEGKTPEKVHLLLKKTAENTLWRQKECMNLIPSEMTISPMSRLLSVMDPAFRYGEHRKLKAFYDMEVYYYQGTDFIRECEELLAGEMREFMDCLEVETRLISGQTANMAVFSAMVDYINRGDRKREPRRIRQVMNHHIVKGGHLSAQPMGALRDFVARDPRTERPAVVNFPVMADNPHKIDVRATLDLIDEFTPELIIFGKSVILHKEPIAEVRRFIDETGINAVIVYDMAHVLGLIGPLFQEPFKEGADLVTGSTHKTFFGTQRGIIGSRFKEDEERYDLWEAVGRRAFPGSVSNHHLGTLLGLLMAAYEMNHFKEDYQRKVIGNAKALARALSEQGLEVAGDRSVDFTETHQVVVRVGYGKGHEIARRLEENNIICNFQAGPEEEGFTTAGYLRLGVSEMTRFGMEEDAFRELAGLMYEVIVEDRDVLDRVRSLREHYQDLKFCFRPEEFPDLMGRLRSLI
ncbi:MAG: glycine cleavage system protein T [Deltaproteobacteria bacterium]|nr:glycine cleavage system protein T [Deltaproteobacteria bacterium]MBW2136164.1 glycine cleavage system protein T [Deltaproteobacteria bacterium]